MSSEHARHCPLLLLAYVVIHFIVYLYRCFDNVDFMAQVEPSTGDDCTWDLYCVVTGLPWHYPIGRWDAKSIGADGFRGQNVNALS